MGALALIALLASNAPGGSPSTDDARATMLKAVAGAFEENRAKFTRGTLRFDYLVGFADGADSAHAGNLRDASVAQGSYAFLNEGSTRKYAYRREFREEDYAAKSSGNSDGQVTTLLDSFRAVTDGSRTMFDQITWFPNQGLTHLVDIRPGAERFFTYAQIPYDIGFPEEYRRDLAQTIRLALGEGGEQAIESMDTDVQHLGRKGLVRFRLKMPNGFMTCYVDPERDWSLLHERSEANGGTVTEHLYGDLRQVPGAGWLPFVQTTFLGGLVYRIVIREADCERPPSPGEFRLEFPKPRTMADAAAHVVYREPRSVWDLFDLPSPVARGVRRLPITDPPSGSDAPPLPPLPGEREPTPWFLSTPVLSVLALLAAALLGWVVYRRR